MTRCMCDTLSVGVFRFCLWESFFNPSDPIGRISPEFPYVLVGHALLRPRVEHGGLCLNALTHRQWKDDVVGEL